MNEEFLYYLWRHQKFDHSKLKTIQNQYLKIIKPGFFNTNSGPDFSEGHIQLDNISWYGNIEIHVKASDWILHKHQQDQAYNNVVLHVVWENDQEILRQDGSTIPTIELKNKVHPDILSRYNLLKEALDIIPCRNQSAKVDRIHILSMLERCTGKRLQRKAEKIITLLEQNKGDWEETAYQLTMKYLGFKVNAHPMEQLSKMIPFSILRKNGNHQKTIEALFFGQAGLIQNIKDAYAIELNKQYEFLSAKYNLPQPLPAHLWKFMRMRPANFPTLRLAQLAAIIKYHPAFFDSYLKEKELNSLKKLYQSEPAEYWSTHYHFDSQSKKRSTSMGINAINLLLINVVVPIRAAYALYSDNYSYMEGAFDLLQQLPFENNKIVKVYEDIHLPRKSAFDSQGIITLFEDYCKEKKCLQCDIGVALLKE